MRYNTDKTYQYDLIVHDQGGDIVYEHGFGTDLSPALEKAEEFEQAHPDWKVRVWQRRITYQEGPAS